ncbi:MAG: T9SS response regulator signal transducer PorX [Flavobacteriales bacterium]|jgi:CheY-like chemotaxis protein|tara:strand:- start:5021 stop:6559 length:1539 start_codon:yes stop_codon:yes gene_type:complete
MLKLLWIDDEIDHFKSHILFLKNKGYETETCLSGQEAISLVKINSYDAILIDQNMPGLTGTETLDILKKEKTLTPVIMITQNSDEYIVDEALGLKVSDYLIKPLNPNQVLLSLTKIFKNNELVTNKTISSYQKNYQKINQDINYCSSINEWVEIYKTLTYWELEMSQIDNIDIYEILQSQKTMANKLFGKYIDENYQNVLLENKIDLSHTLFKNKIYPELNSKTPTLMVLIDNFRYDQWKSLEPDITSDCEISINEIYSSIIPTTTQYSRNSIFSGLSPIEVNKKYSELWKNENEEGGKNLFEALLISDQLKRLGKETSYSYDKVTNSKEGIKFYKKLENEKKNDLSVLVYNFVDMISHAKKDVNFIKELAKNDKAYRSLTVSWYNNSNLKKIINKAKELGYKIIITTDHGTINVSTPSLVSGDKEISTNLRYKTSKRINSETKSVISLSDPSKFLLPSNHLGSCYIFAKENTYFVYSNNYNNYVNMFKNTYQHGGVSLEEMLVPFVVIKPK